MNREPRYFTEDHIEVSKKFQEHFDQKKEKSRKVKLKIRNYLLSPFIVIGSYWLLNIGMKSIVFFTQWVWDTFDGIFWIIVYSIFYSFIIGIGAWLSSLVVYFRPFFFSKKAFDYLLMILGCFFTFQVFYLLWFGIYSDDFTPFLKVLLFFSLIPIPLSLTFFFGGSVIGTRELDDED